MVKDVEVYDIAIVGLGPAGSLFASLLNDKFSVIAFDKKSQEIDGPFKKPCGGLIAPDAQKKLLKLGIDIPSEIYCHPKNCLLNAVDLNTGDSLYYSNSYLNIDRQIFDMWLKSMIPSYIKIINNSICTDVFHDGEYYNITVLYAGNKYYYRSKYIIGADGASSIVRRKLFPQKRISEYLAIQQWFENVGISDYLCVFDSKINDAYSWGIPKGDKFVFGGAFKINEAKNKFKSIKDKLKSFGIDLNNPIKTESCLILRPSSPFQFCCGNNNSFFIGEAAGFISPSSWDGISYALESAFILSSIFNNKKNISSHRYESAVLPIRLRLSLKLLKNFFVYNQLFRCIFFKSKIKAQRVSKGL